MSRLWGGRFEGGLDQIAKAFSFSIEIDQRLYPYDIALNRAHAKGLTQVGVLTEEEWVALDTALIAVKQEMDDNVAGLMDDDEDVHSLVERLVVQKVGSIGKKMHTGKSRNDQVATGMRLWVLDTIDPLKEGVVGCIRSLLQLALRYEHQLFPAFTHFQPAQPTLLSHHLLAYVSMFERDLTRLEHARVSADCCPLGSGAVVGSGFPIDREFVARELGFTRVTDNSIDAVSDRDFLLDLLAMAGACMVHLSRLSDELVLWSSPLIGMITIGDSYTTGSSLMPQKKNPDIAELIRGKTSRVNSAWLTLASVIKGLPLAYNRDFQEDKGIVFDAVDTLMQALGCMEGMLQTVVFHPHAIEAHMQKGQLLATELADLLVKEGVPFRDAHELTGKLVALADREGKTLADLSATQLKSVSPLIPEGILAHLTMGSAVSSKNVLGGTAPNQIRDRLNHLIRIYGG